MGLLMISPKVIPKPSGMVEAFQGPESLAVQVAAAVPEVRVTAAVRVDDVRIVF